METLIKPQRHNLSKPQWRQFVNRRDNTKPRRQFTVRHLPNQWRHLLNHRDTLVKPTDTLVKPMKILMTKTNGETCIKPQRHLLNHEDTLIKHRDTIKPRRHLLKPQRHLLNHKDTLC
jgi:sarcosine oxidase delta subunit